MLLNKKAGGITLALQYTWWLYVNGIHLLHCFFKERAQHTNVFYEAFVCTGTVLGVQQTSTVHVFIAEKWSNNMDMVGKG